MSERMKKVVRSKGSRRWIVYHPKDWLFRIDGRTGEVQGWFPREFGNLAQTVFVMLGLGKCVGAMSAILEDRFTEISRKGKRKERKDEGTRKGILVAKPRRRKVEGD